MCDGLQKCGRGCESVLQVVKAWEGLFECEAGCESVGRFV